MMPADLPCPGCRIRDQELSDLRQRVAAMPQLQAERDAAVRERDATYDLCRVVHLPNAIATEEWQKLTAERDALTAQVAELRLLLYDCVGQWAYEGTKEGVVVLWTGGLSTLEELFVTLGLPDPCPRERFDAAFCAAGAW